MKRAALALALLAIFAGGAQAQTESSEALGDPQPVETDAADAADASVEPESVHALPIRSSERPLTLTEGTWRIDQAGVLRTFSGLVLSGPNQLTMGLTDWLEAGVAWPWMRDPTLLVTTRLFGSEAFDLGLRATVTMPLVRNGDTDLHVVVPLVFRGWGFLRVQTGVDFDFLFLSNVSTYVSVPLTLLLSASDRWFFGLNGAAGLLDGRFWTGQVGTFFGHTFANTPVRPIAEVRLSAAYVIDQSDAIVSVAFSFFPYVD